MKPLRSGPNTKDEPKRIARTSYYRNQSSVGVSPFNKRPMSEVSRRLTIKLLDWFIVVLLLIVLSYALIVSPEPTLAGSTQGYRATSDYQVAAQGDMQGLIYHTKMTFNEKTVIGKLQKQFPEISSASIELPIVGQRPIIHLVISAPALILNSQLSSFVIDSNGVAVEPAVQYKNAKSLPTLTDVSGFSVSVGAHALSSDTVSFIAQVVAQAKQAKVLLTSLSLPALPQELDVRTGDKPYFVKFYLGGDVKTQIGQWLAARNQFAKSNINPAVYLDVRVSGKIFYK